MSPDQELGRSFPLTPNDLPSAKDTRSVSNGPRALPFKDQVPKVPNPIEQVFAKLKALLRKAGGRTLEATWRRIGDLISRFPPAECANYLANAGYASI